jgi:hypothetical protein
MGDVHQTPTVVWEAGDIQVAGLIKMPLEADLSVRGWVLGDG